MRLLKFLPTVNPTYHDPGFMVMFESYLPSIKKLDTLHYSTVTDQQAYKYQGDFYGLLDIINVPKEFHYMVMRVNGFASPAEYDGTNKVVIVPPLSELQTMRQLYTTRFK